MCASNSSSRFVTTTLPSGGEGEGGGGEGEGGGGVGGGGEGEGGGGEGGGDSMGQVVPAPGM